MQNLLIQAGPQALAHLQQYGLQPNDIQVLLGAAGGPKWLILSHLDRMLFSDWLPRRSTPLQLIGSSSGAWRFAALSQRDPLTALDRLEKAYSRQAYSDTPTPAEVTRGAKRVIEQFLQPASIPGILTHPYYRLAVLAVRPAWRLVSAGKKKTMLLMLLAIILNTIHRRALQMLFQRVVFHDPRQRPRWKPHTRCQPHSIPLSETNLKQAVLASGSIPVVTEGVRGIPGAPPNLYLDGGILDYHLDLPLQLKPQSIVLFPHYAPRLIPGWLDKGLKWRRPDPRNLSQMVLISPSSAFIDRLPLGKIPDRNDFIAFRGRDAERIAMWRQAIQKSAILADELYGLLDSGKIATVAQPFPPDFSRQR